MVSAERPRDIDFGNPMSIPDVLVVRLGLISHEFNGFRLMFAAKYLGFRLLSRITSCEDHPALHEFPDLVSRLSLGVVSLGGLDPRKS